MRRLSHTNKIMMFISAAFLWVGCGTATVESDKVEESEYYREMTLHYDATAQQTVAEFQFSLGGFQYATQHASTIHLTSPSKVLIQGKPAKFFDARVETDLLGLGSYYHTEISDTNLVPAQNTIEFTWVRKDGSQDTQVVIRPTPVTVTPLASEQLSLNQVLTIGLAGSALKKDEFIALTIEVYEPTTPPHSSPTDQTTLIHKTLRKMGDAVFSIRDLQGLVPGKARISIERIYAWRLNKILKESKFSTQPLEVTFTD